MPRALSENGLVAFLMSGNVSWCGTHSVGTLGWVIALQRGEWAFRGEMSKQTPRRGAADLPHRGGGAFRGAAEDAADPGQGDLLGRSVGAHFFPFPPFFPFFFCLKYIYIYIYIFVFLFLYCLVLVAHLRRVPFGEGDVLREDVGMEDGVSTPNRVSCSR